MNIGRRGSVMTDVWNDGRQLENSIVIIHSIRVLM